MATNSNTITITGCDNEIIILAYQNDSSIELCRVFSGFQFPVNVQITIAEGTFGETAVLNGLSGPLNKTLTINLPKGDYSLLLLGVNWGGGQQYAINVNGQNYGILNYEADGTPGLPYYSNPIAITV